MHGHVNAKYNRYFKFKTPEIASFTSVTQTLHVPADTRIVLTQTVSIPTEQNSFWEYNTLSSS